MKRRAVMLAAGAVAALVVASTAWWWFRGGPAPLQRPPLHVTALEPRRSPTHSDKLLAALVNAVDADMRSLELGRWYVRRLQTAVAALPYVDCATVAEAIDYAAIARDVPGANDVTRREVARLLRQLVEDATYKCPDRILDAAQFANVLAGYGVLAFDRRDGLLWGMPGYTARSRLRLPA